MDRRNFMQSVGAGVAGLLCGHRAHAAVPQTATQASHCCNEMPEIMLREAELAIHPPIWICLHAPLPRVDLGPGGDNVIM